MTTKRFDAKMEMKEFFNKEPGPGSYSCDLSTNAGSVMTENSNGNKGVNNDY